MMVEEPTKVGGNRALAIPVGHVDDAYVTHKAMPELFMIVGIGIESHTEWANQYLFDGTKGRPRHTKRLPVSHSLLLILL